MKFTDIVKLKTLIVMFKVSKILLLIIYIISGRKHTFIRTKIRTDRKSFLFQLLAQNYGIIIII